MGTLRESVSDDLAGWIEAQHMFFVSTAPLKGEDRIPAYWAAQNAASIDGLPAVTG